MTRRLLPPLLALCLAPAAAAGQGCAEIRGPDAGAPAATEADAPQGLPEGVTREQVQRGREIYMGEGYCYGCHGRDGKGLPNLGADLTDEEWRHSDGSYRALIDRIRCGVPAEAAAAGVPMPPGGGARLDREELRAVAAYVWTLSRPGGG